MLLPVLLLCAGCVELVGPPRTAMGLLRNRLPGAISQPAAWDRPGAGACDTAAGDPHPCIVVSPHPLALVEGIQDPPKQDPNTSGKVQGNTKQELEQLARDIPCLPMGAFLADRALDRECGPSWLEPVEHKALVRYGNSRRSYPVADLVGLLQHAHPKVRVLAIGGLQVQMEPRTLLPLLVGLMDDQAQGFPDVFQRSYSYPLPTDRQRLRREALGAPVSVGTIASGVVAEFLSESCLRSWQSGKDRLATWEAYWKERRDRRYCFAWWFAAMRTATGLSTPFQADRTDRVMALRAKLDAVPEPDRQWYLLLLADPERHPLVGEAERLALAQGIGRQPLLDFLQGIPPIDDPDLNGRHLHDEVRRRLMVFVLEHAKVLFESADADRLLKEWRRQREVEDRSDFHLNDTYWLTAAMALMPARAQAFAQEGLEFYRAPHFHAQNQRARLYRGLWLAQGDQVLQQVLHGVFSERAQIGEIGFGQSHFFDCLRAGEQSLLFAILRDERFATVTTDGLYSLGLAANRLAGEEVVEFSLLQSLPRHRGATQNEAAIQQVRDLLLRHAAR